MPTQTLVAGIVILIISGSLFGTDLLLKELPRVQGMQETEESPSEGLSATSQASESSSLATEDGSSPKPTVVKKGVSTKKQSGVDISTVLSDLQLIMQPTNESGFLSFIATGKTVTQTHVLLRNNDRAFLFSWMDNDNAKTIFRSLKQELSEQFSGKMTDLIDKTETSNNGPPVDMLSFTDPTLSAEKVIFLRIRTRLYEIHIAKNGEDLLASLIAALSQ